eukprot:Ihof_evm1s441 gene=Ihof_evmTU1s441
MADEIFAFDEDTPAIPIINEPVISTTTPDLSDLSLEDAGKNIDSPPLTQQDVEACKDLGDISPPRRSDITPVAGLAKSAPNRSMMDGISCRADQLDNVLPGDIDDDSKHHVLVVKNIPFNVRNKEFMELIAGTGVVVPQSVHYHVDGNHKFRGMAFAIYKTIESAETAMELLQGLDVHGRKLRVEFKRHGGSKIKGIEIEVEADIAEHIKNELTRLKDDPELQEVSFPTTYTSEHRRYVHQEARKMKFVHRSQGEGEERYITVFRASPDDDKAKSKAINIKVRSGKDTSEISSSLPDSNGTSPVVENSMESQMSQSHKSRSKASKAKRANVSLNVDHSHSTSYSSSFGDSSYSSRRLTKKKEGTSSGAIQIKRKDKGVNSPKGSLSESTGNSLGDFESRMSQSYKSRKGSRTGLGFGLSRSVDVISCMEGSPSTHRIWKRKESPTIGATQITRQPTGPDGTKGFALQRSATPTLQPALNDMAKEF